jgi:transmembrane sensor
VEFVDRERVANEACEWLVRLDGDAPLGVEDREAIKRWAAQSNVHREELVRLAAFWSQADLLNELATPQRSSRPAWVAAIGRSWSVLRAAPLLVAAAAVAAVGVGILAVKWKGAGVESTDGLYATEVGHRQEQELSDGSVVQLNTDSEVKVDYSQGHRIVRLLKGEAHFKVAHDGSRPFDVYAGTSLIRATGTAFSVHVQGQGVTVTVDEGSVALGTRNVTRPDDQTISMLQPLRSGQLAKMRGKVEEIRSLDAGALAQLLAWRDGLLVFTGEPLSEVIDQVSRYTPMRIEIADARLRGLPVGGRFRVDDLDAMLELLESSFGIRVVRLDERNIQLLAAPGPG